MSATDPVGYARVMRERNARMTARCVQCDWTTSACGEYSVQRAYARVKHHAMTADHVVEVEVTRFRLCGRKPKALGALEDE